MENMILPDIFNLSVPDIDKELRPALEALRIDCDRLDQLERLQVRVLTEGASRPAMEAFEVLAPKMLNEKSPAFTFTIKPSTVNMEYATEGFLDAIGDAIVWVLKRIIGVIKTVLKLFLRLWDWITGEDEEGNRRSAREERKEAERLIRKARELERKHEKTLEEYEQKAKSGIVQELPLRNITIDEREETFKFMSEAIQHKAIKTFNKEIYAYIQKEVPGYTVQSCFKNLEVIVDIARETIAPIDTVIKQIDTINEIALSTTKPGTEITEILSVMKKQMEKSTTGNDVNLLAPYSYALFFKEITNRGGVLPPDHSAFEHRSPSSVKFININENDKKDTWWNGSVVDNHNNVLTHPIEWSKLYSGCVDVESNIEIDVTKLTGVSLATVQYLDSKEVGLRELRVMLNSVIGEVENSVKSIERNTLDERIDGDYVWPELSGTINKSSENSYNKRSIYGALNKSSYFQLFAKVLPFILKPYKDVGTVMVHLTAISSAHVEYLKNLEKEIELMEEKMKNTKQ